MAVSNTAPLPLPGPKDYKALRRGALYLAGEQLLIITPLYFTERHHRVALADIQAFSCRKTNTHHFYNALLLFPIVSMATGFAIENATGFGTIDSTAIAGMSLVALFIGFLVALNMMWGPTCEVYLHTAVGKLRLSGVNRKYTADKLFKRLIPQIRAAQAASEPGTVEAPVDATIEVDQYPGWRSIPPAWPALARMGTRPHEFYYWLQLATAVLLMSIFVTPFLLAVLGSIFLVEVATLGIGMWALIAQRQVPISSALRWFTATVYGVHLISATYLLSFGAGMIPMLIMEGGVGTDFGFNNFGPGDTEILAGIAFATPTALAALIGLFFLYTDPWRRFARGTR